MALAGDDENRTRGAVSRRPLLVVDTTPAFREHVASLFAADGHLVRVATNAEDARMLVNAIAPAVIFVDEWLGDVRGVDWIARLRRDGVSVPFVLLLREGSIESPVAWPSSVLVLQKPIEDPLLVQTLRALLERFAAPPQKRTLSSLRRRYGDALPERLVELARALTRARSHASPANDGAEASQLETIAQAKLFSHRLRGTAGAFGFFEVGQCAGRIEDKLTYLSMTECDDDEKTLAWKQIDRAFAEATVAAERPPPASTPPAPPRIIHGTVGATAPPSAITLASLGPSSAKVLLVDDDPAFLEYIEELGRKKLISVITASNSKEALATARAFKPDIAFIDVRLGPDEAPFDLARQLRAEPSCSRMPIGFISAAIDFESRSLASRAGASIYLTKPIDGATFDSAIQQMLVQGAPRSRSVLLLEDIVSFAEPLAVDLRAHGWSTSVCKAPSEVLDSLEMHRPDVLLLDLLAPPSTGLDVCAVLRASLRWQDLPIVFFTREGNAETRTAALAAGADDYLTTSASIDELVVHLAQRVDRAHATRERTGRDALTGLYLRRAFLELLSIRLSEAERHHRPISVAMLDIDYFKKVNDAYGHGVGDQVLLTLGKLLANRFRAEDLRGRWGGEEFIVAFPGESASTIEPIFTRVLAEFAQIPFMAENHERFFVTCSAGIATFGDDGNDVESLLSTADHRLYAAKHHGRNRVVARPFE
jgi:diguanylate cyclase (GGDEF)-like protein